MKSSIERQRYVIVTPARNEEGFIANTIQAVISQTLKPLRWIIVNDGSTDRTQEIVELYLGRFDFITLVNLKRDGDRNFGSKAIAFSCGVSELKNLDYDFIGNLDADISLEPDYYQSIIDFFEKDPKLGIAGGIVYTRVGSRYSTSDRTTDSVGGAVQLFRRPCLEAIGGYLLL